MSADESPPRWHETLYRWLAAPLLITVVGAILINFVIPEIAAKSENHRRALELKTSLVREMSEAAARSLTTARLVGTDVIAKTGVSAQGPFNSGLREWQARRAQIGAELEAYFADSDIGRDWARYGRVVTDVYFLSATGVEDRIARTARLRDLLRERGWCTSVPIDWLRLAEENEPTRSRRFRSSYVALASCVLRHADDIVRRVLSRTPSGF